MSKKQNLPLGEEEIDRSWHPDFVKYTEMIARHPNYKGLFCEWDEKNKRYKWMIPKKSPKGQIRDKWWIAQMESHHIIPFGESSYAKISRLLHPTKKHVCQCCGKEMSIYYEYPTRRTIKKLMEFLPSFQAVGDVRPADYSISDIIDQFCNSQYELDMLAMFFGFDPGTSPDALKTLIFDKYSESGKPILSPGVMSNCPDRFDGFHSDGLCCREKTDKGRHTDNMKTYTQDRRAYEEWADGNYRLANRLMGEFDKDLDLYDCPRCHKMQRMTPDHIGPISLGFCHSGHFAPLCSSCNSSKNNRFSKSDVDSLLQLEMNGEQVISWHAKPIWDLLKNEITDDKSSILASHLMSEYHQNVLFALAIIHQLGGTEFLKQYLHPEYSLKDYKFQHFNPLHLENLIIEEYDVDSVNAKKNQKRYVRIAFESLEQFLQKDNRRHDLHFNEKTPALHAISRMAKQGDYQKADTLLQQLFSSLAKLIVETKWSA